MPGGGKACPLAEITLVLVGLVSDEPGRKDWLGGTVVLGGGDGPGGGPLGGVVDGRGEARKEGSAVGGATFVRTELVGAGESEI